MDHQRTEMGGLDATLGCEKEDVSHPGRAHALPSAGPLPSAADRLAGPTHITVHENATSVTAHDHTTPVGVPTAHVQVTGLGFPYRGESTRNAAKDGPDEWNSSSGGEPEEIDDEEYNSLLTMTAYDPTTDHLWDAMKNKYDKK